MRCFLGAALALIVAGGSAWAHDIPNERVDRAIEAAIEPGRLRVVYEVSLTELTLARDLKRLGVVYPGSDREALYQRYGEVTGPLNARGFQVRVDDEETELAAEGFDVVVEEHPRFLFRLVARLPRSGRLVVRDLNYESSEGTSRLALRGASGVVVEGYNGPRRIEEAADRPNWMLSDAEEEATRGFDVRFRTLGGIGETASGVDESRARGRRAETGRLSDLLGASPRYSWLGLWLIAAVLGAAHAIQPGHGKGIVAAAALGSRLRWRGGLILALATTTAHLASVLVLATVLALTRQVRPAELHSVVASGVGFVIAVLGFWRIGGHLGGHDEHEGRDGLATSPAHWGGLVATGLAAGAVPCWDAVVLILLADVAGALGLGVWLLTGFSVGMAVVLVGVGLLAGRVGGLGKLVGGEARWGRWLGVASGLVLAAIGLYLWLGGTNGTGGAGR